MTFQRAAVYKYLFFVCINHFFVISVFEFPWCFCSWQRGMEDEQLPRTVCCLWKMRKKKTSVGKFYCKGLRKIKYKSFLWVEHCIHLINPHNNLVCALYRLGNGSGRLRDLLQVKQPVNERDYKYVRISCTVGLAEPTARTEARPQAVTARSTNPWTTGNPQRANT